MKANVQFVITQSDRSADGGVSSISNVVSRFSSHNVNVITNIRSKTVKKFRRGGVEVSVLPYDGYLRCEGVQKTLKMVKSNIRAYRHTSATQPDVVHVNDRTAFRGWGIGARAAGAPVVDNVRDTQPELSGMRRLKWLVELTLSARVLTLSDDMSVRWARSLRLDTLPKPLGAHLQDKFTSIYSIVDTERFKPVPDEAQVRLRREMNIDGKPLLTYVASFHPKKAQLPLIEQALPMLAERHPDITVAFVGDFRPDENEQARACQKAVDHLDLHDHVRFAGYQSNVEKWYQAADSTVLASRKEGLARAMIESLACGTPVVSFDVASAHEILTQHNCGTVVPHGAYDVLADAVTALWTNAEMRETLSKNGAHAARDLFNPEKVVQQYQALYEDLVRP